MELLPKDYIIIAGILLTFGATILGHYFTRRNIKTSKFIDVITTERIKWLTTIRNDVSEIVALITNTLIFYEDNLKQRELENPSQQTMDGENYEYHKHYFDCLTKNAFKVNVQPELKDLTSKLTLLKLRFNPKEDLKTLEILGYFIKFYQTKYKTESDLKTANEKIDQLLINIQDMLKQEWEKVKKETKGK
ncbi:MAG: hypothetical protein ACOVOQ_02475 [Flavobacterium sp.]|jgi:hypothetical protein